MGGANGGTPLVGGANGAIPPMGGVREERGWDLMGGSNGRSGQEQSMGGTNEGSGQVLGMETTGEPTNGRSQWGESGRAQAMGGANEGETPLVRGATAGFHQWEEPTGRMGGTNLWEEPMRKAGGINQWKQPMGKTEPTGEASVGRGGAGIQPMGGGGGPSGRCRATVTHRALSSMAVALACR